jgi:hypothetical protein
VGICDFYLVGKKDEIGKLGKICSKVKFLLRTKSNKEEKGFIDWTGISAFIIFRKPDERTLSNYITGGDDDLENVEAADWIGCEPWEENQAAIWWWEIAHPYKISTEVWQMLRREAKNMKVQRLVNQLMNELNFLDDAIMEKVVKDLEKDGSKVEYSHPLS